MARERKRTPGVLRRYVLQSDGNPQEAEPVAIWIKEPTERMRRELSAFGDRMKITGDKENPQITIDQADEIHKQHHAVSTCVDSVECFEIEFVNPDGSSKVKSIETGQEFADHARSAFLHEAAAEILRGIVPQPEQMEKSDALPGSSSEPIPPCPGNAIDVKKMEGIGNETATVTDPGLSMSYERAAIS